MSTLPTLPACGLPATVRIEAYSPKDGLLHGSLDAAISVCADHDLTVAELLHGAGYTVHRAGGGIAGHRCGEGVDYTQPGMPRLKTADVPVHFPYGHPWSCGDAVGSPTSTDKADVTCGVCRSEMEIFPDREPGMRLDTHGEQLADRVRSYIDSGSWDLFRDAAEQLFRHATRRRPGGAR